MYRLARELGYANPDMMAAEIEPNHLQEWQEFFRLEVEAVKPERKTAEQHEAQAKALFSGKRINIRKFTGNRNR